MSKEARLSLIRRAMLPPHPIRRLNTAGTAWRIETYLGRHIVRFTDPPPPPRPPRKESADD